MGTALRTPPAPQPELYRFSRLDFITAGLYVAVATLFAVAGGLLAPLLLQISPNPAVASYAVNLIFYATIGILALAAARRVAGRDLRVLATRPWFTALMVPLAVVVMLILTAISWPSAGRCRPPPIRPGSRRSCSRSRSGSWCPCW